MGSNLLCEQIVEFMGWILQLAGKCPFFVLRFLDRGGRQLSHRQSNLGFQLQKNSSLPREKRIPFLDRESGGFEMDRPRGLWPGEQLRNSGPVPYGCDGFLFFPELLLWENAESKLFLPKFLHLKNLGLGFLGNFGGKQKGSDALWPIHSGSGQL